MGSGWELCLLWGHLPSLYMQHATWGKDRSSQGQSLPTMKNLRVSTWRDYKFRIKENISKPAVTPPTQGSIYRKSYLCSKQNKWSESGNKRDSCIFFPKLEHFASTSTWLGWGGTPSHGVYSQRILTGGVSRHTDVKKAMALLQCGWILPNMSFIKKNDPSTGKDI